MSTTRVFRADALYFVKPDVLRWAGFHLQHRPAQHRHYVLLAFRGIGDLDNGLLGPGAREDWQCWRLARRHSVQGTVPCCLGVERSTIILGEGPDLL